MTEAIGRRELKKLQARKRITEAAVYLFGVNGYQATSVADIMHKADMGLGTFYNYFASKEEVLAYLLDSLAGQLQQRLQELKEQQAAQGQILLEMMTLTAKLVAANRFVLPLFLSAGEHADKPQKGAVTGHEGQDERSRHAPAFMSMFLQLIREGQADGVFRRDVSAELITEMFHSLFQAAAFSSLPLSFEENIEAKLKILIDGIMI